MAQMLKWWHQYGFIITIIGYIFMMGTIWQSHKDAVASIEKGMDVIQQQHDKENADHRVTVLETIEAENHEQLQKIGEVQGKIFDRINQIADKQNDR